MLALIGVSDRFEHDDRGARSHSRTPGQRWCAAVTSMQASASRLRHTVQRLAAMAGIRPLNLLDNVGTPASLRISALIACEVELRNLTIPCARELRFAHRAHPPDACWVHLQAAAFLLAAGDTEAPDGDVPWPWL
ncbi:hypothetical protein [Nocardia brasiliensis]|uniref:hypothetical protein n=1 Tax=Nocardia brasiliensis TaxID=37326 RepID=UPI00245839E5|nr:hypothetical protein [Nocardia brasiliensis]